MPARLGTLNSQRFRRMWLLGPLAASGAALEVQVSTSSRRPATAVRESLRVGLDSGWPSG
jgi:hypothetical protein